MSLLSENEIKEHLSTLNNWQLWDGQLKKDFLFRHFSEALAFIVQVGIISEKMDHHPEINNVYNKVVLQISTHSMKGITMKDIHWVKEVDSIES